MSSPHDFDFLHGAWEVHHRRRTAFLDPDSHWEEFPSTARCRPLFDGAANIDEIDMPHLGTKGLTLRLFDRESGRWSLNWSSSRSGRLFPPMIGGFGDADVQHDGRRDRGEFYGDDTHDGKDVRARFVWSGVSDISARWEQAFSLDGGETWLTNWIMDFTRPETDREAVSPRDADREAVPRPETDPEAVSPREADREAVTRPETGRQAVTRPKAGRQAVTRPEAGPEAVSETLSG